jgi:WD40 repeat protein
MEKNPIGGGNGGGTGNLIVELDHAIGYSGKIVNSVHLHPNASDYVLIAGASIIVGDINDPHNQHFLRGHDDQITCLALSHGGKLIASGQRGDNSDILIWDYDSKKAIFRLSEHDYEVACLHFSNDDMLLLSTGSQLDGKMFIWDTSNGYIVTSMQLLPTVYSEAPRCLSWGGFVKDIKLRPTGSYQFATSGNKKLMIWSLEPSTGALEYELVNTGTFIRDYICFAFSLPSEQYLFAGTRSGDFVSFQLKHKLLVFVQNVCAQGVT